MASKPDYIDIDGDGNTTESMKVAAKQRENKQSGGMVGAADMSAKKTSAPKKKKMPQYYMGGGKVTKTYANGGGVRKPKYNKKG